MNLLRKFEKITQILRVKLFDIGFQNFNAARFIGKMLLEGIIHKCHSFHHFIIFFKGEYLSCAQQINISLPNSS